VRKDTVGDELIWEMILDRVHDDLILVSRDTTYRNHVTFLTREYREGTGCRLGIEGNISVALQQMGVEPSGALLRIEGRCRR